MFINWDMCALNYSRCLTPSQEWDVWNSAPLAGILQASSLSSQLKTSRKLCPGREHVLEAGFACKNREIWFKDCENRRSHFDHLACPFAECRPWALPELIPLWSRANLLEMPSVIIWTFTEMEKPPIPLTKWLCSLIITFEPYFESELI